MAGVLVFLSDKLALMRTQGSGDLLLLSATVLFSAHTVAATRLLSRHGIIVVMACSTLRAMARMLLINAPQALLVPCTSLPATLWWALLWSLAVASFAGWLAWSWLNAYVGVPRTAPLLYLLPPVAGLVSWMALGDSFNSLRIAGAVMAGIGVAATQLGAAPRTGQEHRLVLNGSRAGGRRHRIR